MNLSVKNFENRLACAEVTDKSLVSCFLVHSVELFYVHIMGVSRWIPVNDSCTAAMQAVAII